MKLSIFILCTVLLFSCQSEIDKHGGISITIINENKDLSAEELEQDFNTLKSRLDEVVKGSYEIRHLQDKNTIKVSIPKENNLDFFQWLLTAKGHFQLKETYNSDDVWKRFDDVEYVLGDSSQLGIAMYDDSSGKEIKRHLFNVFGIPDLRDMRPSMEMGFANKKYVPAISKVFKHPDMLDALPTGLEPMWMMFPDTIHRLIATKKMGVRMRMDNESVDKCEVEELPKGTFNVVVSLKPEFYEPLADFTQMNLHGWTVTTIDENVYAIPSIKKVERDGVLTLGVFESGRRALALSSIVNNPMLEGDWDIAQSQMMGPKP